MKAYIAGSETAFAELYQRYEARLFSFLQRRLPVGRKDAAADLFQKTWLQIHHARKTFDPGKTFASWAFTISLNALRDHVGKAAFRHEFDADLAGEELPSGEDLQKNLLVRESLDAAMEILASLPEIQREVFLLSEWDGLSSREIASILETSENAVRQTLFRARRKIRELLKEREEEEP